MYNISVIFNSDGTTAPKVIDDVTLAARSVVDYMNSKCISSARLPEEVEDDPVTQLVETPDDLLMDLPPVPEEELDRLFESCESEGFNDMYYY